MLRLIRREGKGGGGGRARSMPGTHHHPQPTSTTMITNLRAIRGPGLKPIICIEQNIYYLPDKKGLNVPCFGVLTQVKLTEFCKGFNCHLVNNSSMLNHLL